MKKQRLFSLFIVIILLMTLTGTAFAVEHDELAACEGEEVEGTVTAVDAETGTITVLLEDGETECTVETTDSYDHPITDLLGYYFADANPDTLAEALETTAVCATVDEDGNYILSEFDEEGVCDGVELTVIDEDDGVFTAATEDGEKVELIVEDEDTAGDLNAALHDLKVDLDLDEDGHVEDAGDDIGEYHDDGWGFGVLVKLYAISLESYESCLTAAAEGDAAPEEECVVVTVEELMAEMEAGASLGDLFKKYGRPSMMGVGHIKQTLSGDDDDDGGDHHDDDDHDDDDDDDD